MDIANLFQFIKSSGSKGADFLKDQASGFVEDTKNTFSVEGILGKKTVDPKTGEEGKREGGWLQHMNPIELREHWTGLDVSQKRHVLQRMKSPAYTGDFKKVLDEIKGRQY